MTQSRRVYSIATEFSRTPGVKGFTSNRFCKVLKELATSLQYKYSREGTFKRIVVDLDGATYTPDFLEDSFTQFIKETRSDPTIYFDIVSQEFKDVLAALSYTLRRVLVLEKISGCPICRGEKDIGRGDNVIVTVRDGRLTVTVQETFLLDFQLKYCPNCGEEISNVAGLA